MHPWERLPSDRCEQNSPADERNPARYLPYREPDPDRPQHHLGESKQNQLCRGDVSRSKGEHSEAAAELRRAKDDAD